MDILAHGLWAGAVATLIRRRRPDVGRKTVVAIIAFAVLPDLVQLAPALAASASDAAPLQLLYAHITAVPATQSRMPPWADELAHHLHCVLHSVIVAGFFTILAAWKKPKLLFALAGWWLHIALDIPTHSDDYYAVPIFYPLTYWGFNGVAWTEPWMLTLNYIALGAAYLALRISRPSQATPP